MPRRVFFSFHYKKDFWRVNQIRNIGALQRNYPVQKNAWEKVKRSGHDAIKRWIREQMKGRSCVVVLIGEETYKRKWVLYEIKHGWEQGKGVLGVYIHNLLDQDGKRSRKGENPLEKVSHKGMPLSELAPTYDPGVSMGLVVRDPFTDIRRRLEGWVEEAIEVRKRFGK